MDSHKPLTAGEIEELKVLIGNHYTTWESDDKESAAGYLARLLTLLTPPPDAAVKEAVAFAEGYLVPEFASIGNLHAAGVVCTLLRAVQSPRLTEEQRERLREAADTLEAHGEALEAQWLRAAFPEVFGVQHG